MKTKILRILSDANEHVSGQDLCEELGVSRTAIWKNINKLKAEGYQIEAVQNKGYQIVTSPDVVSVSAIASKIAGIKMGAKVHYIEEISSTNTWAKQLAEAGEPSGTLVVTDFQSQGKGRRGRVWLAPKSQDIFMSLLLRPDIQPGQASMLTLVMALSVVQGIKQELAIASKIKWPNDIVIEGKKVCGILTEMSAQVDYIDYVVIGVGINCNTEDFTDAAVKGATSLALVAKRKVKRASIIAAIMKAFESNYDNFIKAGDLTNLMTEYNQLLVNKDCEVRVIGAGVPLEGVARSINERGELLVENKEGEIQPIFAGEVSIRGMNGYV
jgi:birA, biotin-[acetyl-CoA-carboxylase] ligase region